MEEPREEGEFIGDCRDDIAEAGTGLGLSSKNETLGEVDVPQEQPKEIPDSSDSDVSGSGEKPNDGEIDKSGERGSATGDVSVKEEDGNADGNQAKDNVESSEDKDVVDNRDGTEKTMSSDDIETNDAITEPTSESYKVESDIDAETVDVEMKKTVVKQMDEKEGSELCNDVETKEANSVEVEMIDETTVLETKSKNDASHLIVGEVSVTSVGNEGTDDLKAECEVEDNNDACDAELNVQTDVEMVSAGKNKADQEKESAKSSDDGDSKQEKEEKVGHNEQGNTESESFVEKDSDSVQVPEQPNQLIKVETVEGNSGTVSEISSATEICGKGQIINNNQEEKEDAMEIDSTAEGQVEMAAKVGGVSENAGSESAGASMVQSQDVPIAETDSHVSNVAKEMDTDGPKDDDTASELTGKIESTDPANRNNLTDGAATGEVEPLDHNALFDPSSDITNFIDFSGVSSWPGNKVTDMTENVAPGDSKEAIEFVAIQGSDCKDTTVNAVSLDCNNEREVGHSETQRLNAEGIENESNEECAGCETGSPAADTDHPKEASDTFLGSEENQEDKEHDSFSNKTLDQEGTMNEQEDNHEAPGIDPNQEQDTEMEDPNDADYADDGTDTDIKTNGVKRKADVLGEDSPREGRKTVSLAKVSFTQRSSFKIGECIARAASQMTESPSLLKGRNLSDENLSVEIFASQLFSAATNPVKANVLSEIAASFFLDHRNSVVSQQVIPEEVCSKIGRLSNSDTVGTKAFEFEETGDTYWNDRVIHNGGEEQTPPAEKRNYQVVPVELKPAQVQRTRRPYRRRQNQIINPSSALDKPSFDENAPAELVMNFSETDTIPAEKRLSNMFRHFGPIKESQTEVDRENNRARVVFRRGADAETAYNSLGRINIFGTKVVNYELNFTISETFKVEPYVVSLGDVDAALCPPS